MALKVFRDEIIARRQKRYIENEHEVTVRWNFEAGVIFNAHSIIR